MYKGVFSFKNIVEHNILAYFGQNNYMEKLPIFDQNNELTTLENSKIFDLFNFLFLWSCFFLSRISWNTFSWPILPKIKTSKKLQILDQTTDLWKNPKFSTFWTPCFFRVEQRFFFLEYRETYFLGLFCQKKKTAANRNLMRAFSKFYNIVDDCDARPYSVQMKPSW